MYGVLDSGAAGFESGFFGCFRDLNFDGSIESSVELHGGIKKKALL